MKVAPALVSLACVAALAACAGSEPSVSSTSGLDKRPGIVVQQMPYKPGSGVVASWAAAPNPAAGATGSIPTSSGTLRMGIKMDDGTMQYVDTDSRDFPIGTRVTLTPDHIIQRN